MITCGTLSRIKNVGSTVDKAKEVSPFAAAKVILRERLLNIDDTNNLFDTIDLESNDDDDNVSVVSSVSGNSRTYDKVLADENMDVDDLTNCDDEWNQLKDEMAKKDVTASLKNLGNIRRKHFNPLALVDLFIEGDKMLEKNKILVRTRQKAIHCCHQNIQLIQMTVKYFVNQMKMGCTILWKAIKQLKLRNATYFQKDSVKLINISWL